MKKLNRLQINSEKIMKNEELIVLRGGYGSFKCRCGHCDDFTTGCFDVNAPTLEDALIACGYVCQGAGATCDSAGCPQPC